MASTGSAAVVGVVRWGILVALLVLRRFRHLVVFVGSFLAVLLAVRLATVDRPRPFGVELRGSWAGWAMPSRPVAIFAATLVGVLYTLVPEGRWRQLGKWVATGLVTAFALARVDLGVDAPTDALVGAVIGVAVSVAAYRLFVPSEVFPVAYQRGRSAHLDVGGRRGEAIRDALADQLGLTVVEVKPFGLSGSAGSTPLRIQVQDGAGDTRYVFGKLYARSHLRADRSYKLGRALLYGRLEDEKPFNTVKRLVQQEDYALALMQRAGLPSPQPYGVAELTPEREYLIVFEFLDGATETRRGRRRRRHHRPGAGHRPQALGRQPRPPRHQAGQPAGPRRQAVPDRRVLRRDPPQPVAPSRRPGQHAALPGPAVQPTAGLPAGAAALYRSARSTRRSPPPAGSRCPPSSAR